MFEEQIAINLELPADLASQLTQESVAYVMENGPTILVELQAPTRDILAKDLLTILTLLPENVWYQFYTTHG